MKYEQLAEQWRRCLLHTVVCRCWADVSHGRDQHHECDYKLYISPINTKQIPL